MRSTQANFQRKVHCIMGLPFDAITLEQAVQQIREAAFNRTPCFFSTPNLNFLIASQSNEAFRQSVIKSDLSLADGMPIVWMAKLMGIPITERVAGSDVFDALRKSQGRKVKVYFFGGPPGVADQAMAVINAENGGLECVGYETPGFGSIAAMSSPETINKINASGAEFLVVALGAVKGQAWIENNLDVLNVPVVSHLGAVVNFVAGNINRAPRWMQRIGLEWLWRIVEEPSLWIRYVSDIKALIRYGFLHATGSSSPWHPNRREKSNIRSSAFQHSFEEETLNISIPDIYPYKDISPIRQLLNQYAVQDINIQIKIGSANAIGSEFQGLLSLACGQQLKKKRNIRIEGPKATAYSFDAISRLL